METDILLVLVAGIPASGKSYFCEFICKSNVFEIQFFHVSYDDFFDISKQKEAVSKQRLDDHDNTWKLSKEDFRKHVEWFANDVIESSKKKSASNENLKSIILIDDNFYYKSMRYKYYQLACTLGCGFCQLFFECDLNTALERNKARSVSVPEEFIVEMSNKFELPNAHNSWEKYSLVSSSEDFIGTSDSMFSLFMGSLKDVPVIHKPADVSKARNVGLMYKENFVHQVDIELRRVVGLKAKTLREAKMPAASFCYLNEARKKILNELKHGTISIPYNATNGVINDDCLKLFVESLFELHIKNVT